MNQFSKNSLVLRGMLDEQTGLSSSIEYNNVDLTRMSRITKRPVYFVYCYFTQCRMM